jgi:hypothetical protein
VLGVKNGNGSPLPEINIDVIGRCVAGIIHFLQTPVFTLSRDPEREIALPDARLTVVDMADPGGDRAFESELLRVD